MFLNLYFKHINLSNIYIKRRKHNRISLYRNLFFPVKWHSSNTIKLCKSKVGLQKQLNLLSINFIYEKPTRFDPFNFWFFLYQQYYLGTLFKLPVKFKNMNSQLIVPSSLLAYMTHSVKLIKWKKYYIMHSNEIIEVLFICLWLKNIKLFMDWMRKYFERTNLKKHRKLFLLLNLLLGKLVWNYNLFLQLKGLRVILRGKFGKAGSVRKTRKYIKRGKCSYTAKNIALVNQTNIIRTLTGVFAIKFEVFF